MEHVVDLIVRLVGKDGAAAGTRDRRRTGSPGDLSHVDELDLARACSERVPGLQALGAVADAVLAAATLDPTQER